LKNVLDVFNETALKVCEGQQFDMDFENDPSVSEDQYLNMIELKTSVLLAGCLKIGAIVAEAPETDTKLLYEFGKNIGLAFQLQDDYLDVYGNTDVFGKKIGGDIVANKKTFLLIKALELSKNNHTKELQTWINKIDFNREEKVAEVTKIYNDLGIQSITKAKIDEYHKKALEFLDKVEVESDRKQEIYLFTEKLMARNK